MPCLLERRGFVKGMIGGGCGRSGDWSGVRRRFGRVSGEGVQVSRRFLAGVKSIGKGVSSAVGGAGVRVKFVCRGVLGGSRGGGELSLGLSVGGVGGRMFRRVSV